MSPLNVARTSYPKCTQTWKIHMSHECCEKARISCSRKKGPCARIDSRQFRNDDGRAPLSPIHGAAHWLRLVGGHINSCISYLQAPITHGSRSTSLRQHCHYRQRDSRRNIFTMIQGATGRERASERERERESETDIG